MILYKYALDEQGKRVSIFDLEEKDLKRVFICPECKSRLRPRAINSQKRTKHFYHYNDGGTATECGGEGYVHWITKELLAESLLDQEKSFMLRWTQVQKCIRENALNQCVNKALQEIDLVKEYPIVEIETKDDEFIPDITLKNNFGDKIYIEIYSSNKVSEKKRKSGIKVIEIQVQTENSIDQILKDRILDGNSKPIEVIGFELEEYDCNNECPHKINGVKYVTNTINDPITPVDREQKMINFFNFMKESYSYESRLSEEYSVIYKGDRLLYISYCNEFFTVSAELYHLIVYTVSNGQIVELVRCGGSTELESSLKKMIEQRNSAF